MSVQTIIQSLGHSTDSVLSLIMQHLPPRGDKAARLIQLFMYLHGKPADNAYARPLDFVPVVDLNRRKVLSV